MDFFYIWMSGKFCVWDWGKSHFDVKNWSTVNRSQRPQSKNDLCNSYWIIWVHGHGLAVKYDTQILAWCWMDWCVLASFWRNDGKYFDVFVFVPLLLSDSVPFLSPPFFLFLSLPFFSFFQRRFWNGWQRARERWGRVEVERETVRKKERNGVTVSDGGYKPWP